MFFASKIREAAKSAGVDIDFVKRPDGIIEKTGSDTPSVVIIDLNCKKIDTMELMRKIRNTEILKGVYAIGYLPHVEKDLMKKAYDAGYDTVLPRSLFSTRVREMFEDFSRGMIRESQSGQ
jgi:PleD family two-component response regulator